MAKRKVLPSTLTLDGYQEHAGKTARYPYRGSAGGLIYAVLGLAGEAGELANKLKKVLRGDPDPELFAAMCEELGDVLWYCSQVAHELGTPLAFVARENLAKLAKRYPG